MYSFPTRVSYEHVFMNNINNNIKYLHVDP